MIKGLTLILGGVRSGKSSYALSLAKQKTNRVTFLATAKASDLEMKERIEKHKQSRPEEWQTIEGENLVWAIGKAKDNADLIIIDCLTIFTAGILFNEKKEALQKNDVDLEKTALKEIDNLVNEIDNANKDVIIVSSEVGQGVVPAHPSGRAFRDILGLVNQRIARHAEKTYLMIAGIPVELNKLREPCQPKL
ncbi:hypothetical protein LCGC14_1087150 [marine sediment metagenome]|uniref:Adenosylcobinamide kinase n=1 Tax=marine sediment metagenome TaxID=412755 RepID=A0A0F9QJG9_9ZZZZ|nr:bifunctional adenosylcobinamide kinase/adenosylcobinamide-phosphate guanylyltransferase [Actinomycetota bacterium]